jgi:hypothetical protein
LRVKPPPHAALRRVTLTIEVFRDWDKAEAEEWPKATLNDRVNFEKRTGGPSRTGRVWRRFKGDPDLAVLHFAIYR